jgi:hypothetical protein
MEQTMAKNLSRSITTAVLAAAFALGGLGVAAAHHGDVTGHSTTKGKNIGEIERMERQITAELNRKQAMQGSLVAMAMPAPMTDMMPSAMPTGEEASLVDEPAELAAVEEEDSAN